MAGDNDAPSPPFSQVESREQALFDAAIAGNPTIPKSMKPANSPWRTGTAQVGAESDQPAYSPRSQHCIEVIKQGLASPACSELHGYGPGRLSAKVNGANALLHGVAFETEGEYLRWLRDLVESSNATTRWRDVEQARMGVLTLRDGARLAIFLPPTSPWPTFSIRKHTAATWRPHAYVDNGTMDERMLLFLQACVAARVNMLIVGAMGSGKTSLLRSLAQSFGDNERVGVFEQVPELGIAKPLTTQYIYQQTVDGLGLSDLLEFNLYNSLDRLIVGEAHFEGITRMLQAMIVQEGSLATYHAWSAEHAGERMKIALQVENPNMTPETASAFIRQAIEVVVVLEQLDGQHRLVQVTEVDWRSSGGAAQLSGSDLFAWDRERSRFRAKNPPDEQGRIIRKARHKYGVKLPDSWFVEQEELDRFLSSKRRR